MHKAFSFLLLLFIVGHQLSAQIFPKENSKLHYRIIGFSFPEVKGVNDYSIEVATGNYNIEDAFKKNIIATKKTKTNKLIIEVPSFGKEYTWRVVSNKSVGVMHHFSCPISSEVDTNVTRLCILQKAEQYKDAYVFMDGSYTLYDMNGNPVWYLPVTDKLNPKKSKLWDMKLTPQGTITFLLDQSIYEINYDADVLWKGPNTGKVSGDSVEFYHHELMKLSNGHYMVLGTEFLLWSISSPGEAIPQMNNNKEKTAFGTIIEYDRDGNVVWSWKSSQYFKTINPKYLRSELYETKSIKQMVDVHENAFYFDEKEQMVYLSFKNISTILKIKYPEGNVLHVYGKLARKNATDAGNEQFCGQHSCKTTKDGYLFLYNNNACHQNALPKIVMFEQPKDPNDTLKKIWEYDCSFEDVIDERKKEAYLRNDTSTIIPAERLASLNIYSKGGNLIHLPDNSIFVSICGIYGKTFIITPGKKIVWSALLETWDQYQRKWVDVINYKSNIILNRGELEQLIWHEK